MRRRRGGGRPGEEDGKEEIKETVTGMPKEADTVGWCHSECCISIPKHQCCRGSCQ